MVPDSEHRASAFLQCVLHADTVNGLGMQGTAPGEGFLHRNEQETRIGGEKVTSFFQNVPKDQAGGVGPSPAWGKMQTEMVCEEH